MHISNTLLNKHKHVGISYINFYQILINHLKPTSN
jgi:hypothetical protein